MLYLNNYEIMRTIHNFLIDVRAVSIVSCRWVHKMLSPEHRGDVSCPLSFLGKNCNILLIIFIRSTLFSSFSHLSTLNSFSVEQCFKRWCKKDQLEQVVETSAKIFQYGKNKESCFSMGKLFFLEWKSYWKCKQDEIRDIFLLKIHPIYRMIHIYIYIYIYIGWVKMIWYFCRFNKSK